MTLRLLGNIIKQMRYKEGILMRRDRMIRKSSVCLEEDGGD